MAFLHCSLEPSASVSGSLPLYDIAVRSDWHLTE